VGTKHDKISEKINFGSETALVQHSHVCLPEDLQDLVPNGWAKHEKISEKVNFGGGTALVQHSHICLPEDHQNLVPEGWAQKNNRISKTNIIEKVRVWFTFHNKAQTNIWITRVRRET